MITQPPGQVLYLDASALVKRYVAETGSSWVIGLCHPPAGNTIATARISKAEAAAAFARKRRSGGLTGIRRRRDLRAARLSVVVQPSLPRTHFKHLFQLCLSFLPYTTATGLHIAHRNDWLVEPLVFRSAGISEHLAVRAARLDGAYGATGFPRQAT